MLSISTTDTSGVNQLAKVVEIVSALMRLSPSGAAIVLFCIFAVFMIEVYFLAIAFQAAYHTSATSAGVRLLPLILVQVFTLILSSRIIPKVGRFKWVIVAGPVFISIASGCLYTVKYGTPITHLYGFQVLLGVGIGMCMQNSMLAVQVRRCRRLSPLRD